MPPLPGAAFTPSALGSLSLSWAVTELQWPQGGVSVGLQSQLLGPGKESGSVPMGPPPGKEPSACGLPATLSVTI